MNYTQDDTVTRVSDALLEELRTNLHYLVKSRERGNLIPEEKAYAILADLLKKIESIELEYAVPLQENIGKSINETGGFGGSPSEP